MESKNFMLLFSTVQVELFSSDKMMGKINENDLMEIKEFICSYENVSKNTLKRFGLL